MKNVNKTTEYYQWILKHNMQTILNSFAIILSAYCASKFIDSTQLFY